MDSRGKIVYLKLSEKHVEPAGEVVARAFYERDVLTVSLGEDFETVRLREINLAKRSLADGVGMVAIDSQGQVVGADLPAVVDLDREETWLESNPSLPEQNESIFDDILFPMVEKNEYFQKIREVNYEIRKKKEFLVLYEVDAGVHKNYGRIGICTRLMKENIRFGQDLGCAMVLTEATSRASAGQVRKVPGFVNVGEINYPDIVYNGKKPFSAINDTYTIYIKSLIQLDYSHI